MSPRAPEALAPGALRLGARRFERPSHDRMLDWLVAVLGLGSYTGVARANGVEEPRSEDHDRRWRRVEECIAGAKPQVPSAEAQQDQKYAAAGLARGERAMRISNALSAALLVACIAGKGASATGLPSAADGAAQLATAEKFIDAFYSFDPARLAPFVATATPDSRGEIVFYQQWAVGAHYSVVRRHPCRVDRENVVACAITVEDDLMKALKIDFNVTDEFHLSFTNGTITQITTTSDDPSAWENGKAWIRKNRADLIAKPCQGYFAGGPTPGECARAMVQGLTEFRQSPEYRAGS